MNRATTTTAAAALGITPIRLRQLCQKGRVRGAEKFGRDWMVPFGDDGRPVIAESGTRGPAPTLGELLHESGSCVVQIIHENLNYA